MTTSNGTCGGPKNCTIFARIARQRLLRPTSVHIEPNFTPAELLADRLSQLPDGPDPGVTDVGRAAFGGLGRRACRDPVRLAGRCGSSGGGHLPIRRLLPQPVESGSVGLGDPSLWDWHAQMGSEIPKAGPAARLAL